MISVIIKGSLDEQIAINRELKLEIQSLQNQLIKVTPSLVTALTSCFVIEMHSLRS